MLALLTLPQVACRAFLRSSVCWLFMGQDPGSERPGIHQKLREVTLQVLLVRRECVIFTAGFIITCPYLNNLALVLQRTKLERVET